MKKIKLIIVLCALITVTVKSQPYGSTFYARTAFFACGGGVATATDGIIMASYVPSNSSLANFGIDRTGPGGVINLSNGYEFTNDYSVTYGPGSCNASAVQATICAGVSVIETVLSAPTRSYALTGATDEGVFFGTLFPGGGTSTSAFYRFPSGAFSITKPLIVESTAGQQYFICGSYSIASAGAFMYALKVGAGGGIINSRTYQVASGIELIPYDIIISPYNPAGVDELVVVGRSYNFGASSGIDNKPFFMRLKQSDLTNLSCRVYGQLTTFAFPNDWFSAITVANSTTGGDGFVVAGHCDSLNTYPVLIEKLDHIGRPTRSQVYMPFYDDEQKVDPVDVIERYSNTFLNYEYYAATTSSIGMLVLKTDDNGAIFTSTVAADDVSEFLFRHTTVGNPSQAVALSYLDNGGSADLGLQVFGTFNSVGLTYFVESPFNGHINEPANCSGSMTGTTVAQLNGPMRSQTVGITTTSGLSSCNNFTMTMTSATVTATSTCVNASLPNGGSLDRDIVTEITKNATEKNQLIIYPNPATEKIYFELGVNQNTKLKIDLYDALGRFISRMPIPETLPKGKQSFEINPEEFSLKSGIYFLNIQLDDAHQQQKLIYTKE